MQALKIENFEILDKESEGLVDSMTYKIRRSIIWKEI